MVGGTVIEVLDCGSKVWVNCQDQYSYECAIYVEHNDKSKLVSPGDSLWWQSGWAFWTPKPIKAAPSERKGGIDYDIKIPRIGFSGVKRPSTLSLLWKKFLTLIHSWK